MAKQSERIEYKDKMGRWLSQALFYETSFSSFKEEFTPIFTLNKYIEGYRCMREEYLEIADPTEYKFAIKVLGSWDHWKHLCKKKWFLAYVEGWREELELKLRSEGIKKLHEMAHSDKANALVASKYLADKGWVEKQSTRGRPSKEEKLRQAKIDEKLKERIERDLKLIKSNV